MLVFWSEEDKGFIAVAPDLPGCSAWGENRVQAMKEMDSAIFLWIEAMKLVGNPIPEPSDIAKKKKH